MTGLVFIICSIHYYLNLFQDLAEFFEMRRVLAYPSPNVLVRLPLNSSTTASLSYRLAIQLLCTHTNLNYSILYIRTIDVNGDTEARTRYALRYDAMRCLDMCM